MDTASRLARENGGWGVRRILGELKKLAVKSSRSTVRRVLVDENIGRTKDWAIALPVEAVHHCHQILS